MNRGTVREYDEIAVRCVKVIQWFIAKYSYVREGVSGWV
jgi:hypothetical protein